MRSRCQRIKAHGGHEQKKLRFLHHVSSYRRRGLGDGFGRAGRFADAFAASAAVR